MTLKGKNNHYNIKFLKGYGFSIKVKDSKDCSQEYINRSDNDSYGINGGNATFQFIYKSVQNDYHVWNFTDPLSIMVKGCVDNHNEDIPCR